MLKAEQAWQMLQQADMVCEAQQVDQALGRLAEAIDADLRDSFPLLLCVMNGGVYFCGRLLPLLRFPLTLDYVHASRYGEGLDGRDIRWRSEPQSYVEGRTVLIVDDILDEGVTLAAIRERVLALGATQCRIAVLAEKDTGKPKPVQADYVGVRVPNRFVFGCGLDAHGLWRNLPAIYALKS